MKKTISELVAAAKEPFNIWKVEGELPEPVDPNVSRVCKKYLDRAKDGMLKYGVTTERTDIDFQGWINHLQEELMDATIYLERIKQEIPNAGK